MSRNGVGQVWREVSSLAQPPAARPLPKLDLCRRRSVHGGGSWPGPFASDDTCDRPSPPTSRGCDRRRSPSGPWPPAADVRRRCPGSTPLEHRAVLSTSSSAAQGAAVARRGRRRPRCRPLDKAVTLSVDGTADLRRTSSAAPSATSSTSRTSPSARTTSSSPRLARPIERRRPTSSSATAACSRSPWTAQTKDYWTTATTVYSALPELGIRADAPSCRCRARRPSAAPASPSP